MSARIQQKKLKKAQKGDVLLTGASENIKDIMTPLHWLGDTAAISGDMFAFRPCDRLHGGFLTHILHTHAFFRYKQRYAHGAKITRLRSETFLNYKIPLPSLAVQQRIANILDTFDTLVCDIKDGLPAEIALRQKQYAYYRELLLDFSQ